MNWRRPSGEVMPRVSRASSSGRETGARPISVRIAGSTNTSKEMYAETELPGSVKIGLVVLAEQAEALRLAGLHRHRAEPDALAGAAPP